MLPSRLFSLHDQAPFQSERKFAGRLGCCMLFSFAAYWASGSATEKNRELMRFFLYSPFPLLIKAQSSRSFRRWRLTSARPGRLIKAAAGNSVRFASHLN